MAYRIEIGETVENAAGLNITGASVVVKYHGGAQAPVYSAENGGSLVTQPIQTVNGKIGGDYPGGAWVAEGDYDLEVTFGGSTLVFFWSAVRGRQLVTTLPAGAGTSAPEDGEWAVELYDAANGAAWMRRYRGAASAWDMIGGPPPAGGSLPGSPRARQEFYLTGGSPAVQHMRYNGSSWDYVGTPPTVPITGSPGIPVLDVGQIGQERAGRQLLLSDWTTLLGLAAPIGLWNLSDVSDASGNGRSLTNKNSISFTNGIEGQGSSASLHTGDVTKFLYITDTGASDPLRIKTGSFGAWVKTAKRGVGSQKIISKNSLAAGNYSYQLQIGSGANQIELDLTADGTNFVTIIGTSDISDNRWHHVVATSDGARMRVYVDGVMENIGNFGASIFGGTGSLNIGATGGTSGADAGNAFNGSIDEAFVTDQVLSLEQIRLLYAAKLPHGLSTTPTRAHLSVRRARRGAALATTDFPAQPKRLHNFIAGALTDQGSDNQTLTASGGSILAFAGPDGSGQGSFNFVGGSLQATDTGLPSGTASRTYGAWFKTTTTGISYIMGWGTTGTADARLQISASGNIAAFSGADFTGTTTYAIDGLWHLAVVVEDNAAVDGVKRKLYYDGRVVATSLVLTSLTLAGANRFRVGAAPDGTSLFTGQISRAFVYAGALTAEQVAKLYQKGAFALGPSPILEQGIEAMDDTYVYMVNDDIESQNTFDLAVAA